MSKQILPPTLTHLIEIGVWPSDLDSENKISYSIRTERVKRIASDESKIYLYAPPFSTVAKCGSDHEFWQKFGALAQIDAELALIIADFGLGADSPIILDYARNRLNPPVLRLQWLGKNGNVQNEWTQIASDFDQFVDLLGLVGRPL